MSGTPLIQTRACPPSTSHSIPRDDGIPLLIVILVVILVVVLIVVLLLLLLIIIIIAPISIPT